MRILTGVKSSGVPHLGNLLGAIQPAINLSKENETFLFVANMHSITTFNNKEDIRNNIRAGAATYIALGYDINTNYFYKQSDIPEVGELQFYLNCFFGFNRLQLAHSFKSHQYQIENVNVGLYTYPMLMAADILLYDAQGVPVGKDQSQHLEYTKEVARKFNNSVKEDVFTIPEYIIQEDVKTVPGTNKDEDGNFTKMSKSYDNTINIFQTDKKLRKEIMGIQTDSTGASDPKNPETCIVFNLYKLLASRDEIAAMREHYKGGIGYGQAKEMLYQKVLEIYGQTRDIYFSIDTDIIDDALEQGAKKVRPIAQAKMEQVRNALGL
jgi:tryptophanyl-tRNA synthetase